MGTEALRAIAGLILVVLAVVFMLTSSENASLEMVMLSLAAFLVGGAFFNKGDQA